MNQQMMGHAPAGRESPKKPMRIGMWTVWTLVAAWAAPYALAGVIAAALCSDVESFRQLVSGMATGDMSTWHSFAVEASNARLIIRGFVVLMSIWLLTGRKVATGVDALGTAASDRIARLPVMLRMTTAWNRIAAKEVPRWVSFLLSALFVALFFVVWTHPVEHVHPPFNSKLEVKVPSSAAAITLSDGRILSGDADVHQDAQGNYVVSFTKRDTQPGASH